MVNSTSLIVTIKSIVRIFVGPSSTVESVRLYGYRKFIVEAKIIKLKFSLYEYMYI